MELCRPLPWIADDKPRLGDFRRELIGQLKETLQKSKHPPGEVTSTQEILPAAASPCPAFDVKLWHAPPGNIRLGAFRRQPLAEARSAGGNGSPCGQIRS